MSITASKLPIDSNQTQTRSVRNVKTGSNEIYVYFILAISHIANNILFISFIQRQRYKNEEHHYYWGNGIVHYYFVTQMYVQRKTFRYTTTTRYYCETHHAPLPFRRLLIADSVGYVYGTLWLEGIFACFKEIETYIIIIMIIIFNTIQPSLRATQTTWNEFWNLYLESILWIVKHCNYVRIFYLHTIQI